MRFLKIINSASQNKVSIKNEILLATTQESCYCSYLFGIVLLFQMLFMSTWTIDSKTIPAICQRSRFSRKCQMPMEIMMQLKFDMGKMLSPTVTWERGSEPSSNIGLMILSLY